MSPKRKTLVLAVVVVLLLALGVSQLRAQSPLTLEGLSERISELARPVSNLRRTGATKSEIMVLDNRVATVEARLAETPTATSAPEPPTATSFVARSNDDLARYLLEKDNAPTPKLQAEWNAMSQQVRDELVRTTKAMLEIAAEYCNMSAADTAEMIDRRGQHLDDAGWSAS